MKKVLVAGAALMMVAGPMISAATAEVNLSGDARVRYIGMSSAQWSDDFTEQSDYQDKFNSRIRVKFDAKAKGGAFAKARVRFDDFTWDGQGWGASSEAKNVWADYAYIGIPMGPVVVSGGRMPADFSKFFEWDERPTRVKADYNAGSVRIIGLYDMESEYTGQEWDDNDIAAWGLVASVAINDNMTIKGYARYQDDQRDNTGDGDSSGFLGSLNFDANMGMFGIEAEVAYKGADVQQQYSTAGKFIDDDGLGMFGQVSFDLGAFTPAIQLGYTQDGYKADDDFGFIMIGAAEPITVINNLGTAGGDTFWGALTTGYQVSEQLKMAGNLVYYDIDINDSALSNVDDVRGVMDMWEISGSITYTVSEGADVTYKVGYLDQSYDGRLNSAGISEDGIFGHYVRLAVKF